MSKAVMISINSEECRAENEAISMAISALEKQVRNDSERRD